MDRKILPPVDVMIRTSRMHKHFLDAAVSELGIHRTQHMILMHIAHHKRISSQKCLASHIGVTSAAITVALKKLVSDGYIKKLQGSDNRFNEVQITAKGKELVERTHLIFSGLDAALFDGFTDEQISDYIAFNEKIQSNIKKHSISINKDGEEHI